MIGGSLETRPEGDAVVIGPRTSPDHEVRESFPSSPASVAAARHFVRTTCDRWHIRTGADVEVCASEVVANAVIHGHGQIDVEVVRTPWGVRVAISDEERTLPVVRPPNREGEGGRGMAVVSALALRWAARPTDTGKVVWFHVSDRAG